jgi:hypothetical protein
MWMCAILPTFRTYMLPYFNNHQLHPPKIRCNSWHICFIFGIFGLCWLSWLSFVVSAEWRDTHNINIASHSMLSIFLVGAMSSIHQPTETRYLSIFWRYSQEWSRQHGHFPFACRGHHGRCASSRWLNRKCNTDIWEHVCLFWCFMTLYKLLRWPCRITVNYLSEGFKII